MGTAARSLLAVSFLLVLAAPFVFAEPAAPPVADEAALLAQLTARDPQMQPLRSGDRPNSPIIGLFGDLSDPQGGSKAATALAFITTYGTLLGFPAGAMPAEMQVQPAGKREKGDTLTYVPVNSGVKYPGGAVQFGYTPEGKLVSVTGRFKSAASAAMGGLSAEDAARKALSEMHKQYPGSWLSGNGTLHESLEDTDDGKSVRRVWRVRATMGDKRRPVLVSLGPGGEVLDQGSSAEEADAVGKVYTSYPDIPVGDGALPKMSFSAVHFGWGMYGQHFEADSSIGLEARVDDDGRADYDPVWFTIPAAGATPGRTWWNPRFLEVNVYHHLMTAHDKASEWGAAEVDDTKIKFDVYYPPTQAGTDSSGNPDFGASINNGFFNGVDRINFARDNPRWDNRTTAADLSIIYHEYGHYVCRSLNASYDQGGMLAERCESRALGEGWADAFACSITGKPHVMWTWKGGDQTEPTGVRDATRPPPGLDYCSMFPCSYGTGCVPAGPKGNCHQGGRLFSILCWSMKDQVFGGDASWLMRRLIWAMRDTSGPATLQKFCSSMLSDEILYGYGSGADRMARFKKMYELMQVHKLYDRTCP